MDFKIPWKKRKSHNRLLEEEATRLLLIMRDNSKDSDAYKKAFNQYRNVHYELLEEKKLTELRHSRWFEAATTGILAGVTMTQEYWAPITSKWASSITRPFKPRKITFGEGKPPKLMD